MQPKLKTLVDKGLLWQGQSASVKQQAYLRSGSDTLDKKLGGGWQLDGLHECQRCNPFTEQRLLHPILQQAKTRNVAVFWISPPAQLSAAGLASQLGQKSLHIVIQAQGQEAAWAFEQVLQSGAGVAFLWGAQQGIDASTVRRWYKAAQHGRQPGFVFTDPQQQPEARAYTNRLMLHGQGRQIDIIKRRYGWPVTNIAL